MASLVDNSGMFIGGLVEAERKERLIDDGVRSNNAHKVAQIIKTNSLPELKTLSCMGLRKHLKSIEEQERKRMLGDLDEMRAKKANGMAVASIIKVAGHSFIYKNQGTRRYTNRLEEKERQRRIDNREECVARKVNAFKASDAIRTDYATIRARFTKRASVPITRAWLSKAISLTHLLPSISTIAHKAAVIKENLVHSIQTTLHGPTDLVSVKALEEQERARRIAEDTSGYAICNAHRISNMLKFDGWQSRLSPSRGFKRYTHTLEEYERTRRLQCKSQSEANRAFAREVSLLISQLGWPLLQSRKGWASTPFAYAVEEERERRLADKKGTHIARHNATKVAGMVIDAFQFQTKDFILQCTKELEEKERKFRIANGGTYSVHNSHRQAQLIRDIGGDFYHPCSPIANRNSALTSIKSDLVIKKPKGLTTQKEQKFDLQALRRQDSGYDTKHLISSNPFFLMKQEKKRRLADKDAQRLAMVNASKVSRMIKQRDPFRKSAPTPSPLLTSVAAATISPACQPISVYSLISSGTVPPAPKDRILLKKLPSQPELIPKKNDGKKSQQLIDQVTKLYQRELQLAEKEKAKVINISRIRGLFADYRVQKHTNAASRHEESANRHAQWLKAARASAPTLFSQAH